MIVTLPERSRRKSTVETLTYVDRETAERFLRIYRAAFAPLETLAPARQGLTDGEFLDQMFDPSVLKFVARDDHGEPAAMAFMATDLSTVPWISVPYFRAKFPEHFARGAIYYFGALLVSPDHQGGPWASRVVRAAAREVTAARAIAVFDCCEHNVGRKLPEVIARLASCMAIFNATELEAQRYYAYVPAV
jgi:GNAT superfamily N-acetyltransferase